MLNRPQVFIGGDNSHNGAWPGDGVVKRYLHEPEKWSWVRANVDGYYLNNFAFLGDKAWIGLMADLLTHKAAFYESDMIHCTVAMDEENLKALTKHFKVKYATLNRDGGDQDGKRYSQERIDGLKSCGGRPVLAMEGPFAVDEGIDTPRAQSWLRAIDAMNGASTDGPLGLWFRNEHNMQAVTRDSVHYAHDRGKLSMVMLATHESGSGDNVLKYGQECVRWLERQGAMPDIWAISFYHFCGFHYPVTPETNADGSPAGTVTGLAYWLINYLRKARTVTTYPHQSAVRHAQWREVPTNNGYVLLENRSLRTHLEVKNDNRANPASVGVYTHHKDTAHAHWRIKSTVDGYLVIKDRNGGRSLQVDDALMQPNASVSVYQHVDETEHALWKKVDRGDGWFSLVPKHSQSAFLQIDVSAKVL